MDPPPGQENRQDPEKIRRGRKVGSREAGGEYGREEEDMRKWDAQEGGKTVRERKERVTLIEGAINGLSRNSTWEISRNPQG